MELLSSYKEVIEFFKLRSYFRYSGRRKLGRGQTLNNTTTFSIYVLYKTHFYLLNLLKVS